MPYQGRWQTLSGLFAQQLQKTRNPLLEFILLIVCFKKYTVRPTALTMHCAVTCARMYWLKPISISTMTLNRTLSLRRTFLISLAFVLFSFGKTAWAQSADMVFSQHTISPSGSMPAGSRATISLKVTNNGPDLAQNVIMTDTLPAGASFVSMTFPGGVCTPSGTTYQCALGDMPFDTLGGIEITLVLDFPQVGFQQNTASLSTSTTDPNAANNSSTVGATVTAAANLRISASSVAAADTIAGAAIDYTLKVDNAGSDVVAAGSQPTVNFEIPAGATITGIPTGDGWTCTPAANSYPLSNPPSTNTLISCTRNDALAIGARYPEINVPAVGNVNGTVTANFGIQSSASEGNNRDNTAIVDVVVVDGTDMAMNKTVSPSGTTVSPGSRVTYTLQALQNGGVSPTNVMVTDTLPAGLTFDPSTFAPPAPWQCGWADQTLTCTYPGVYSGGPFSKLPPIQFDAILDTGATGSIVNEGVVSAEQNDPDSSNDASQATISSSSTADQRITKTASVTVTAVGTPYTYKLVARNLGPINVRNGQLITVSDAIPSGMSLRAMPSGSGWTCALNPAATGPITYPLAGPVNVACTRSNGIGTPANWAEITVPVVNTVAGSTSNTACVKLSSSGSQPSDTNAANDCVTVGITVNDVNSSKADLAINKTASSPSSIVGDYITYTITVINNGPDDSTNVVITDELRDLLYVSNSLRNVKGTAPSGNAICTPADGAFINPNAVCTFPLLKAGETATMTMDAIPSNATAATKNHGNKATVVSKDVEDPVSSNNSKSITTTVEPRVDVTAGKTVAPTSVRVQEPLSFTISALNSGPSIASNVKLSDVMPANTSFLELTSVSGGGTCTTPAIGATAGTIECTWPTVGVKVQQTAVYKLLPSKNAVNTTITNTVVASTSTLESNTNNNSAQSSASVTAAELDILVQKTDTVDPVALGDLTEYIITISNAGPSEGTNLVMTDTFPNAKASARFSYQGGLVTSTPATSCTEPKVGDTTGVLECSFPSITKGTDITVRYKMKAEFIATEGAYSGTQGNDVHVKVDETETLMTNNDVTEDTTTRRDPVDADLAIAKQADKTAMKAGETVIYTLTVTNNGPTDSSGAQIIDVLPAGMSFVSSADGCVDSTGTVTCSVGTLANGTRKAFRITVSLDAPYTGTNPVVNTATVDAPGDKKPANNKSSANITVTPTAFDLALAKQINKTSMKAGETATYTLTVTNNGPAQSAAGQITDTLPAGMSFIASADGCTNSAGTVSCSVAVLANGASKAFAFTVSLASPYTGASPIVNNATVTAPGDTNPANDKSTVTVTVTPETTVPPATAQPIPTLSDLGVWLMLLLIGAVGVVQLRRRN